MEKWGITRHARTISATTGDSNHQKESSTNKYLSAEERNAKAGSKAVSTQERDHDLDAPLLDDEITM